MLSSSIVNGINTFTNQYSFYSCIILFVCGIVGNILNILVFTQLKLFRGNRCVLYLTVEAIADIGWLTTYFTSTMLPIIYGYDPSRFSLAWCRLRTILIQTCTLISVSTVCFAACDQFCSTSYRFYLREIWTLKLARCLTTITCCISLLHSILYGFLTNVPPLIGCVISNRTFTLYSTIFYFPVLIGLLPITVSSIFSALAARAVRRIIRRQMSIVRRRLDRQMTVMVLMRVVLFVIFRLPFVCYHIYAINNMTIQTDVLRFGIELLIQAIFNSFVTGSFYIFMISSSQYRRQVKRLLLRGCSKVLKFFSYNNRNQVVAELVDHP